MYKSKWVLLIFVFLVAWMGFINIVKAVRGESIAWGNFVLSAIGITGIVAYFI
jgi:hypothetical protein